MAITPLPPAPEVTDDTATFNTKAFAWVNAIDDFTTEANALAVDVNTDAGTASSAASTATSAANTATTKAGEASNSADAAAASALEAAGLVENYQGALASDPLVNKDGDPLQAGDWYVNTSSGLIRAYDGSQWVTSVNVTAGVESFSAGTTGLTPSTGTTGDVTLGGTLSVANGGTGATSLTGVLKGNGTSAVTAGDVDLTADVTGTLPVANGGTGQASLTANSVLVGNGTSGVNLIAPSTSGNVLTSNGTAWVSSAPAGGGSWEHINSITVSGNPFFVDIDHAFSNDYSAYVVVAEGLSSSNSSAKLYFRTKVSGTVQTGSNYYYHMNASVASNSTYQGRQGSPNSVMKILEEFQRYDASIKGNSSFVLYIYKPADSTMITVFNWNAICGTNSGTCRIGLGGGVYNELNAIDGLRFFDIDVSATFTTGKFHLYRIKNS